MCSYNDFVECYNNPTITGHDVRRLTGLNSKQYGRMRAKALKLGDIPASRYMINTNAKYYTRTSNGDYQVQKTIDGKKIIIGRFPSENIAVKVVNACIDNNWEIGKVKNLINLLEVKPKNYSRVGDCWVVQKSINGKNVVFNSFSTNKVDEQTIIRIVDWYRENNWELSLKDEVKELFNIT